MSIILAALTLAAAAIHPAPTDAKHQAHDPVLTASDRALIKARCGNAAGDRAPLRLDRGALICPDGRRFEDPETRAMAKQVGERANAHVDRAMSVLKAIGHPHKRRAASPPHP